MTRCRKAIVIILVVCSALLWFEASVANRVKKIESAWMEFKYEASSSGKVLNQITINFGYGGLIHNFKNYVLRRDPALIPKIKKNFKNLFTAVNQYNALNISQEEKKSLSRLKNIIGLYQLNFKFSQNFVASGKAPQQIDVKVKINDQPAFDAISFLTSKALSRYQQKEFRTTIQLEEALFFQKVGSLILIPLLLFVGSVFLIYLRKVGFDNEKVERSRLQLQKVFEASPDAMFIINHTGVISQVNKRVSDLFGYSADELVGQSVEMLMPERFRKKHVMFRNSGFRKEDDRAMKGGQEFFALKKNGTEITIDIGLSFFEGPDGKQAVVILRDITEKKIAETTLRRNQDVLNKAQRIAHLGSWEWDLVTNTVIWSDEVYRILGFQPQEVEATYDAFLACMPPNDKEKMANAINEAVENNKPYSIEHRIIRTDGSGCLVHESGEVFKNDAGEALYMVCTVHDITERKLAEAELKLADNVFSHTDEAIIVTGADKKVLRINQAFTVISGFSEKETLGKHPDELLKSGEHDDEFYQNIWACLNEKSMWEGEVVGRRKSGELFPSWHNMSVVRDEHGDIIQYISIFSDITEKKRAEESILRLAQFDQLTGLPNRSLFNDRLQHAISRAGRAKTSVGLMFIDLDRFKNVNDTLGHQAGDRLLQVIAERLSKCVRTQDTVARLGGDEFTIVLEDLKHAEDAAIVAEKLLECLSHTIDLGGHEIVPGASIGISIFPEDGSDDECIIKNADIAMYQAKQKGRNRYQFYTQEFSQHADLKFHMEKSLRHALENNELEVYYQPQVNLKNGVIAGAEALVRWNSPEKGLLSPAEFLPFAEENGLIEPIGVWVLETACAQAKAWHDQGLTQMRMSVNVAGYQITHGHIVESTKAALKKSGLAAEFLELEITEDFVMDYLDKGVEKLKALQALGVSLAIDDFGTGYSSLSYLKKLPIDRLKIDRSFVMDMSNDKDDEAIVSTIIAMAKSLGLSVTAEGAECDEHIRILADAYCEEVQGYYFSKPVPEAEFRKLLASSFDLPIDDNHKLEHGAPYSKHS